MKTKQIKDSLETGLIWLSASDAEVLKNKCPKWEKIKYEAFGASVLVPVFFGMIASSYAVSTLTNNWLFIGTFSLVWGFIILTIDRVLLSTYRAFVSKSKKWIQFCLRITVAVLMGLTVSHPLTLLLFKDTIQSEIEKERTNEMLAMRQKTEGEKKAIEERIRVVSNELADHQKKYQETVSGEFLNSAPQAAPVKRAPIMDARFADIDAQIREYKNEREEVRRELERWQVTYDEEVRGLRSGKSGVGPNARAIERDHLGWRRDEIKRLNNAIGDLTSKRSKLSSDLMVRSMEANASLEASRRDLEKQKIAMFASQQGQLLEVIKGQIDSTTEELAMLRRDANQLATDTSDRVADLKVEKRSDLMAQTHTLHKMFKDPEGGGTFALAVYIVLVGLFTLIDTIPLVVKFCAVPGLYDKHLHYKENSVRALGENQVIDDSFSDLMKREDQILHGLLHYDPGKLALASASPAHGSGVTSTFDDPESFVDVNEQQIEAIEGVEIIPPNRKGSKLSSREFVPREIRGQIDTSGPEKTNGDDSAYEGKQSQSAAATEDVALTPQSIPEGHDFSGTSEVDVIPGASRIAEAEAAAEAQRIAEAEAAAQAQRIAEAEAAVQAQRIAEAEAAVQAQRIAEAEAAVQAQQIAETEAAAQAQRIAETEEFPETQEIEAVAAMVDTAREAEVARLEEIPAATDDSPGQPATNHDTAGVETAAYQDLSEIYQDEPSMMEPGFGAVILGSESETADFSAEIEIPVKTGEKISQPVHLKHDWKKQRAAGGLALQPTNLSEKAR